MTLIENIQADLKAAMTAREDSKRDTLRLIMADLRLDLSLGLKEKGAAVDIS